MKLSNHSQAFRVLHWAMAISFILLLGTIFLRVYWMNIPKMATIVQEQLANRNISITYKDAIQIVKPIRKPMWDWHFYLGYILTGLLSIRVILHISKNMKFQSPFNSCLLPIERFKNLCYIIFYILFLGSLVTGLSHQRNGFEQRIFHFMSQDFL